MSSSLNRRGFLGAAGLAGLTVAGGSLLTACGSGAASGKGGAAKSAKVKLPTYIAANVAAPDLAGNADGLDPAYLRYPKKLVKSVAKTPGDGKPITALTETFTTAPPAMGRNAYWQELNKQLGSEFRMTVVNGLGDDDVYRTKLNALTASDDLPDLVWFPPNQGLKNVPQLLEARFHDLTSYLSGDAVKEFPNLANIPDFAWKTAVINGKIWGTAVPYGRFGQVYVANSDFWKPVGGVRFDDAEDFLAKGKDLLDIKRRKYVLEPAYVNHVHMFSQWYGAPNVWSLKEGKLTARYETEEYLAAIEFALKCRQADLFWPDPNLRTTLEKMGGGYLGAHVQSFPGLLSDTKMYDWPMEVIVPFAAESGASPKYNLGIGSVGFVGISKKADKSRIKTLLAVMDYLNAPFGSEERLFLGNGIEGTHHTRTKDGDVTLTPKGEGEALTTFDPLQFLGNTPETLYTPGKPEVTRSIHETQTELLKIAQADPTIGFYSDTYAAKWQSLRSDLEDDIKDIVAGRKPLSTYKESLKKWLRDGGDAIRGEFEDAIAKGSK
ncbi:hypothetical protein [Streptomyces sp. N35]|uniref:hypothetical protein n=1 Tax=Streptomyces sp. N35 TaxID=2795730 RepID=UPI0018F42952|nr:hypothetical protein [Streptomyces sp. N35]